MVEEVEWSFHGYRSPAGGTLVQDWFNSLEDDARDEIRDALVYLQNLPLSQWRKPEFFPLGQGLSEIRVRANELRQVYRVYGFFWPTKRRYVYTFLLGNEKKVKNPMHDIEEARKRQRDVEAGRASIHVFDF